MWIGTWEFIVYWEVVYAFYFKAFSYLACFLHLETCCSLCNLNTAAGSDTRLVSQNVLRCYCSITGPLCHSYNDYYQISHTPVRERQQNPMLRNWSRKEMRNQNTVAGERLPLRTNDFGEGNTRLKSVKKKSTHLKYLNQIMKKQHHVKSL